MTFRFTPVILFSLVLLAGCGRPQNAPAAKPMTIGSYYWPGMYWADVANAKGWFAEAGLNVTLIDTNRDYNSSLKDVIEGRLDTQNFPLFDLVKSNAAGAELVMVVNADVSLGGDAIIGGPTVGSLVGLRGKRVGVAKGTYHEYILSVVLQREGLSLADVQTIDIVAEKAPEALVAGTCEAVVAWEPYATEAMQKAGGRKLFDTSHIPGLCPFGYAFRRQFIAERQSDVEKFVQVWHRTNQFIARQPDEAFSIVARVNGKTVAEVRELVTRDRILGLRDNLRAFGYDAGFDSLHGTARLMNSFLVEHALATKRLDSGEFLDARFVKALK